MHDEAELIARLKAAFHNTQQPVSPEARMELSSPEAHVALMKSVEMIEHLKMRIDQLATSRHGASEREWKLRKQFDDVADALCVYHGYAVPCPCPQCKGA